ncbi:2-hydroxychromene-2-carboxylate isomerase [Nitratireductor sp. ZSWI3]|uniref:2-hydroxychromene-2-carboxylate isomerase n=1 Tax=Nitratireductor sp. ZSWI3 TaxID=2966359 RepID=UPI00214FE5A6|nr:2-hydroxychromene-2-carboxylate isomerase [Nitratireductor sp. ZSWI3]MCR4269374.1 2-hydroxychromene-2-carboxylate isomerase [Nitratireductor sp. ZSWI3]
MTAVVDYYITSASPFTYLGHGALRSVTEKHGARVRVKPVNLMGLWEISGAVPPAKRPPVRQRLRLVELQRIADFRGLPINTSPKHWPVDPALSDHVITALVAAGHDPMDYMGRVFSAVWANEENIADAETLARHLKAAGFDARAILDAAGTEEIATIRARNTQDAVAADAVGVPTFVLNGEAFFGQDRVEYLDRALETGRQPFTA